MFVSWPVYVNFYLHQTTTELMLSNICPAQFTNSSHRKLISERTYTPLKPVSFISCFTFYQCCLEWGQKNLFLLILLTDKFIALKVFNSDIYNTMRHAIRVLKCQHSLVHSNILPWSWHVRCTVHDPLHCTSKWWCTQFTIHWRVPWVI